MDAQSSGTVVAKRDKNGRLLPGASLNPGGRIKKAPDKAIMQAIDDAMPPEAITELIVDAMGWCRQHRSVKGAVSLLQLVLGYKLGTPVKRVVSARLKVDDILGSVAEMDDDQFEQTIEALYTSDE